MCWRSEEAQSPMPSLVDSVNGGREGMRALSIEETDVRHEINVVSLTQMLRDSIIYQYHRLDTSKMIRWMMSE